MPQYPITAHIHFAVTGADRDTAAAYLFDLLNTGLDAMEDRDATGGLVIGAPTYTDEPPTPGVAQQQILTAIGRLGHRLALYADSEIQELGRAVADLARGHATIAQVADRLPGWELHGLLDGIAPDGDHLAVNSEADAAGWDDKPFQPRDRVRIVPDPAMPDTLARRLHGRTGTVLARVGTLNPRRIVWRIDLDGPVTETVQVRQDALRHLDGSAER